ncbi:MAG: winged helix-turn-helix transcriptional regulator, partial [Nitrososphaerota archaeon]|nr:winged helix-turn-helix transcriptional regulator [Nitrososphaerota archaeon]
EALTTPFSHPLAKDMAERESQFDASRAELFEALGHPARVQILRALERKPLGFAELKREVGIESSGHLQFHLRKLTGLVGTTSDGVYALTDEGREAIRVLNTTTTGSGQIAAKARTSLRRTDWTRPLLAVLLIGLVVLAGVAVYQQEQIAGLNSELSANGLRPSWLFKGAYAFYAGSNNYTFPANNSGCPRCTETAGWNVRLQVENFNSTDVEMMYFTNQTSSIAPCSYQCSGSFVTNTTNWYDIRVAPTLLPISILGMVPAAASYTTLVLNGHTYDVTLYPYQAPGSAFDVYVYTSVGFPILYSSPATNASHEPLNIWITQTNIPGLTPLASTTP